MKKEKKKYERRGNWEKEQNITKKKEKKKNERKQKIRKREKTNTKIKKRRQRTSQNKDKSCILKITENTIFLSSSLFPHDSTARKMDIIINFFNSNEAHTHYVTNRPLVYRRVKE